MNEKAQMAMQIAGNVTGHLRMDGRLRAPIRTRRPGEVSCADS
jgi:hypothetical protein